MLSKRNAVRSALVIAVLFFTISLVRSQSSQMLTGVVSDASCGSHHFITNMTPAECTRACIGHSKDYGLVVGNDTYTLKGHGRELDKLAGKTVTVEGAVNGKTVTVKSVMLTKKA